MLTKVTKLRFWCQKVLPLVYDDSLSYYELLCKVVKYLNDHTEIINQLLQFMNDFNSEVEEVLKTMIEDGELDDALKESIIPLLAPEYDAQTGDYEVRDIVAHDEKLYKCIAPTSGEWDENDWEEITIGDELTILYNNLANYVTYVTPEMFGAVGDGTTDDTLAVQQCFSSPVKLKMLCRSYKITSALTVIDHARITGGGWLNVYSNYGIVLDHTNFVVIDNLDFTCYSDNIAAIYIKTDNGASSYNTISNCLINAHQYGIYVNRTSEYCNEFKFINITIFSGVIGIYINNADTTVECNDYYIEKCAAETVTTAFLKIKNVNRCVVKDCRTLEDNGTKITTEGTCNNFIVYSSTLYANAMEFSNATQGIIFGKLRSTGIYDTTFGGYAIIKNGKIIPYDSWRTTSANNAQNLNQSVVAPSNDKYIDNFWYSYNDTTEVTLTLSPDYYGGHGLINKIYVLMADTAKKITVVNGDQTFYLENNEGSAITYELTFFYFNDNRRWRKNIIYSV